MTNGKQSRRDEFSLIHFLTGQAVSRSSQHPFLEIPVGDDAAVFTIADGMNVVTSCDTMVEHVHFTRQTLTPEDIGYKSLAVNLSDIAAMGGIPRFYLVALAIPQQWGDEELKQIYHGMDELAQTYDVHLIGGDTVATSGPLTITVTVLGEVEKGKAIPRSGARPGDILFVTGHLGASAAGLHLLMNNGGDGFMTSHGEGEVQDEQHPNAPLILSHRRPLPGVEAGRIMLKNGHVHALNDISDGLASEAWEIADASGVTLILEESRIPVLPETVSYARKQQASIREWVCYGGEDYQLLGTVAQSAWPSLEKQMKEAGIALSAIGRVEEGTSAVLWIDQNGRQSPLKAKGYNHFSAKINEN